MDGDEIDLTATLQSPDVCRYVVRFLFIWKIFRTMIYLDARYFHLNDYITFYLLVLSLAKLY